MPRASRVGKRGVVMLPARLRRLFHLAEGAPFIAEAREDGILIRPATVSATAEVYTPARIAEFLLNDATTPEDYWWALEEARRLGIETRKRVRRRKQT